ncbi:Hydrogenase transcriptional regulatory protein HoxA [Minicystis rosea]|nr:Hydrogenase transcriptional regulatory protein HoxA [Minicystis rosea]
MTSMDPHPHMFGLLVVDDEVETLRALRRELRREYEVYTAESADEALRLLRERAIQVVITDQRMPGTTGTELLRVVQQEFPDKVRLLLTAYADINAVIAAINVGGVHRYLMKPWDPSELAVTVREAFHRYQLEEENRRLVAELRHANEQLVALDGLRGEFVHMVAHDLRNMVNVIQGFSSLLRVGDAGRQQRYLQRIDESAAAVTQTLSDLLDSASIEHEGFRLDVRDVDIAALVLRVVGASEPSARHKSVGVQADVSKAPPLVPCDPSRIERVLGNLLLNALRFSPPGGTVRVTLDRIEGALRLSVIDEGAGIPAEDVGKVFSKYWRANPNSARGERNVGLGLSICKIFVERHGGTIGVESVPGRGSTFWFTLPYAEAPARRERG